MESLPPSIIDQLCIEYLENEDIKNLRLTCREFSNSGLSELYRVLRPELDNKSFETMLAVVRAGYGVYVEMFHYSPTHPKKSVTKAEFTTSYWRNNSWLDKENRTTPGRQKEIEEEFKEHKAALQKLPPAPTADAEAEALNQVLPALVNLKNFGLHLRYSLGGFSVRHAELVDLVAERKSVHTVLKALVAADLQPEDLRIQVPIDFLWSNTAYGDELLLLAPDIKLLMLSTCGFLEDAQSNIPLIEDYIGKVLMVAKDLQVLNLSLAIENFQRLAISWEKIVQKTVWPDLRDLTLEGLLISKPAFQQFCKAHKESLVWNVELKSTHLTGGTWPQLLKYFKNTLKWKNCGVSGILTEGNKFNPDRDSRILAEPLKSIPADMFDGDVYQFFYEGLPVPMIGRPSIYREFADGVLGRFLADAYSHSTYKYAYR